MAAAATAALALLPQPAEARHRRRRLVRKVVATAYCMGPCRRCETRGRTYTGSRKLRGVAVARLGSRRILPLGSRVYVPGYGWAPVDDVGGGVGRRQIDVRFRSHRRAARWGKRPIRVVALVRS
jgi:3D (Asp-Asp-Asp) domain-containing protein